MFDGLTEESKQLLSCSLNGYFKLYVLYLKIYMSYRAKMYLLRKLVLAGESTQSRHPHEETCILGYPERSEESDQTA